MSEVDVLLMGEMHPSKPGRAKDRLALIGRARSRVESVDFNALFQRQVLQCSRTASEVVRCTSCVLAPSHLLPLS